MIERNDDGAFQIRDALNALEELWQMPADDDERTEYYNIVRGALMECGQQNTRLIPPEGGFCRHPNKCRGLSMCPRDPVCND